MLRKAGLGWELETEEVLEDFSCQYINPLFRWKVLERQYTVNGQRCDILAVDQNQRLVIIELKNSEDRGILSNNLRHIICPKLCGIPTTAVGGGVIIVA